jgi:ESCRT-II complex subunit VPS36
VCGFGRNQSATDTLSHLHGWLQVGLPLRLRKFPSGVTVVQGAQFSDKQLCANIEQLLQRKSQAGPGPGAVSTLSGSSSSFVVGLGPGLSATDVSAALLLPLTLAKEALLVAEASGVLCRDDGPEGLRFFRNFFREATPVAF